MIGLSGQGSGAFKTPAVVIGDYCMFSHDLRLIRNTDAHLIFNCEGWPLY